jgi:hypothetical protein
VPRKLEINLPGVLSILFTRVGDVALAKTPGIIEITPKSIADAHERLIFERKLRLQKLRDLDAPELIIENEIHMLNCFKEVGQNSCHRPEDYAYHFKAIEQQFERSKFEKAIVNLSTLTQLEVLELSGGPVTDNDLTQLLVLSNLRTLCLTNCGEITDHGLIHLAALANLQELHLTGCDKITDDGFAAFEDALPQCEIF